MRGEQAQIPDALCLPMGSSPRARGAGVLGRHRRGHQRIIPACAGSRTFCDSMVDVQEDHPRVRGEQAGPAVPARRHRGSSPRARGADWIIRAREAGMRIIPACAGSSDNQRKPPLHGHGSSPRARGAAPPQVGCADGRGIIPACAGSRAASPRTAASLWDHPRVRGEQGRPPRCSRSGTGSSPRARGAACRILRRGQIGRDHPRVRGEQIADRHLVGPELRIIPACAGSRDSVVAGRVGHTDHPRVRGEQAAIVGVLALIGGSSPRARGAGPPHRLDLDGPRIIPACAGSRGRRSRQRNPSAGSSPRARGADLPVAHRGARRGIIPACAGSRS